jgi:hypothetical protein
MEENFIIEEAEEDDSDEEDEEQTTDQEFLVRYALTLETKGTTAANNRPAKNGEGNIDIKKKNS